MVSRITHGTVSHQPVRPCGPLRLGPTRRRVISCQGKEIHEGWRERRAGSEPAWPAPNRPGAGSGPVPPVRAAARAPGEQREPPPLYRTRRLD